MVVASEKAVATQLIANSALPTDEWAPNGDSAELNALLKCMNVTMESTEAARSKIVGKVDISALLRAGTGECVKRLTRGAKKVSSIDTTYAILKNFAVAP